MLNAHKQIINSKIKSCGAPISVPLENQHPLLFSYHLLKIQVIPVFLFLKKEVTASHAITSIPFPLSKSI